MRMSKKIISFSLWGSDRKYLQGALENLFLAPYIYPGWICRYYVDTTIPDALVSEIRSLGGEVIRVDSNMESLIGYLWRFLAIDDPDVDVCIFRDCDSRLDFRERAAVDEWLTSDKGIHTMHDHPHHACYKILGGMWGIKRGAIIDVKDRMLHFASNRRHYGVDCDFLREIVSLENALQHVGYMDMFPGARPFPPHKRLRYGHFVGQVFDENNLTVESDYLVVKPKLPDAGKIKLPDVTLLIYNPVLDPDLSARALNHCMSMIDFGDVVHLTSEKSSTPCSSKYIQVPKSSWNDGQAMQATRLGNYFNTRWMLHVETDGFPINPHLWSWDFLEYDFIGAPWPRNYPNRYRVGNGGCSIQSKRFRNEIEKLADCYFASLVPSQPLFNPRDDKTGRASDVWFCSDLHDDLEARGIRFAPLDVAIRFSYEYPIGEFPGWTPRQSFAFHGQFEWFKPYLSIVHGAKT